MARESSITQNSNDNRMEPFMIHVKKNGKTYIPKTIPQNRNKIFITFITMVIFLVTFLVDFLSYGNLFLQLEVICYGVLLLCLMELIYRIILYVEEIMNHFTPRYGDKWYAVSVQVFSFSWTTCLIFLVTCFAFSIFLTLYGVIDITKANGMSLFLKFLGLCSLQKIMYLETAPIYTSLQMEVKNGLNYGSGMAYSFFYGYLKKVLAKACNKDENLHEIIENYCDTQGVRLSVSKLLMLIPKSGTCFRSLKNEKFPNIEESSSLPEKIDDVGGVKNRVYKNSVYKIYIPKKNKKVYVCVEFASPLVTFMKGLESNGPHCSHYKVHKEDIILQFYLTLKYLVKKDTEISELCDLIYYDDKDENGDFRDLSQIILTRLKYLNKQKKKSQ